MEIIPDIYDKIGNILKKLHENIGLNELFNAIEVYDLYVQQYPYDKEMFKHRQKKNPRSHSLKGYLNGQVWIYYMKTDGHDPDRPAIEFLKEMTYRFV